MDDQTSNEYLREHSLQIGRVVIAVGLLDNDVSDIVSQALRLNHLQENALLRPMQTRAKVELLGRLGALFLKPDEKKMLSKWCNDVKGELDERNGLIHGAPGHVDGKVSFRTWTGKNKLHGSPTPWPAEKVSDLADRFKDLNNQLERDFLPMFWPTFDPETREPLGSDIGV